MLSPKFSFFFTFLLVVMVGAIAPAFTITANAIPSQNTIDTNLDTSITAINNSDTSSNSPTFSSSDKYIMFYDHSDNLQGMIIFTGDSSTSVTFNVGYTSVSNTVTGSYYGQNGVTPFGSWEPRLAFKTIIKGNSFSNQGVTSNNDTGYIYTNIENVTNLGNFDISQPDYFGTVDSITNAGLIYDMYDISFHVWHTSTEQMEENSANDLIDKDFPCVVTAVYDDSGYNLVSLQVPSLQAYTEVTFYGSFNFTPKHGTEYIFDGLSFAVGTQLPIFNEEDNFYQPDDIFYYLKVGNTDITNNVSLTINSAKFMAYNTIQTYRNRELKVFDYSYDNSDYPAFSFYSVGSINQYSMGTYIFNFKYSGITDLNTQSSLSDDDIDRLAQKGKDSNDKAKDELGYVPKYVGYSNMSTEFEYDGNFNYDWSPYVDLFDIFLQDFIVQAMLVMLGVALASYILFGKR